MVDQKLWKQSFESKEFTPELDSSLECVNCRSAGMEQCKL